MKKMIKLIIADDHAMVRDGYYSIFNNDADVVILGEAANGKELIALLKNKKVDIVLLDHEMPIMNGMETLPVVKSKFPDVKVIIVTMYNDEKLIAKYFKNGANAFITKGSKASELKSTILKVYENGYHLIEAHSKNLIEKVNRELKNEKDLSLKFTERELEIIRLVFLGISNKEIADKLKISVKTVGFHKNNIFIKTGTHNSAGIILYAINHKLINTIN